MAMKHRVRIVNESGHPTTTRILDADTGAVIPGVTIAELRFDRDEVHAILECMAEVDVIVDAEVRRRRYVLNQETGKYDESQTVDLDAEEE